MADWVEVGGRLVDRTAFVAFKTRLHYVGICSPTEFSVEVVGTTAEGVEVVVATAADTAEDRAKVMTELKAGL